MPARSLAAVCVLALATAACAEDITVKALRPGAHVQGPKVSVDGLAGKVVLVEFWGIN